jgi:YD repeat-containing protein
MKNSFRQLFAIIVVLVIVIVFTAAGPQLQMGSSSHGRSAPTGSESSPVMMTGFSHPALDAWQAAHPHVQGHREQPVQTPETSHTPHLPLLPAHETPMMLYNSVMVDEEMPVRLQLDRFLLTAPQGSVEANTHLSVTGLDAGELPDMAPWLINVTGPFAGYRLLPHTDSFPGELKLHIPYDSLKIPAGYSASDVRTYYYHEVQQKWLLVPYDSLDADAGLVISRTDHFTDFVNAIIQTPEAPQTNAYTPTMMSDIEFANPFDGYNVISPPSSNNHGTANLQFPIQIPAGRQGMQPQLAIAYNSEGGNGWLGVGWDLKLPSVSVETRWGVPRYSAVDETESYLLSGEQLDTMVHTGHLRPRSTGSYKEFKPRVEGAFQRILRYATNPKDYHWEVTDRNGVVYRYGKYTDPQIQSPCALKDDQGNIAQWFLTEVVDLHGNFVRYYYQQKTHTGLLNGTVPGRQIYPHYITFTGSNTIEGPYRVQFILDDSVRADIQISGRNGLKEVVAHRLDSIRVFYNQDTIRSYAMQYKEGSFGRSLLCAIYEFAGRGPVLTSEDSLTCDSILVINGERRLSFPGIRVHRFDYYHEDEPGFSSPESISTPTNYTSSTTEFSIGNPFQGVSNLIPKTLSSSFSEDITGGGSLNIGLDPLVCLKNTSIGGGYDRSYSKSEPRVMFMDVNGDGLPDRITSNGFPYPYQYQYQPIEWVNGQLQFSSQSYTMAGLPSLGHETTTSRTIGINGTLAIFGASGSDIESETMISQYFTDVNGDGFVDFIKDGQVYFATLQSPGNIVYQIPSGDTIRTTGNPCNYTIYNGSIDSDMVPKIVGDDPPKSHESVRMWVAPFTDSVKLFAPIRLIEDTSQIRKHAKLVDGIHYTIQHSNASNSVSYDGRIADSVYQWFQPDTIKLFVNKGDRIYFRLNSFYTRAYDMVEWNPEIIYFKKPYSTSLDADGAKIYHYSAANDFMLYLPVGFQAPDSGDVRVHGTLSHNAVSDTVTYQLIRGTGNVIKQWIITPNNPQTILLDDTILGVNIYENIVIKALANTHIDYRKIQPEYMIEYLYAKQLDILDTCEFSQIKQKSVVLMKVLQETVHPPTGHIQNGNVTAMPVLDFNGLLPSGSFVFSAKADGQVLAKKALSITGGKIDQADSVLQFTLTTPKQVYYDFASVDPHLGSMIYNAQVSVGGIELDAGFYASLNDTMMKFGHLYRGWGQFSCLEHYTNPIDETKLFLQIPNQLALYQALSESFFDTTITSANIKDAYSEMHSRLKAYGLPRVDSAYFSMMFPDYDSLVYRGFGNYTMVAPNIMSNVFKKVLNSEVIFDCPVFTSISGERRLAIAKQSVQKTRAGSLSKQLLVDQGESISLGTSQSIADYMDMNGDRYPDLVISRYIQYTNPHGGLYSQASTNNNEHRKTGETTFESVGGSLGISYSFPERANTSSPKSNKIKTKVTGTLSANGGTSISEGNFIFMDVNGDGLPDKVVLSPSSQHSDSVYLNIGYGFTSAEPFTLHPYSNSQSYNGSVSIGTRMDIGQSSWKAGVGGSYSTNRPDRYIADVNGDGLPDIVLNPQNGILRVYLNNGTGFNALSSWSQDSVSSQSKSYSVTGNIGGTYGFMLLGLKSNAGGDVSKTQSLTTETSQFIDLNNDGYPDIVYWDNNVLKVKYSTLGRINLLKQVTTPVLSTIELDYELMLSNTDMPQRKWVMSQVAITSKVNADCGANTMVSQFEYKNGYYDRYDREFYGYDTVITTQFQTWPSTYAYRTTEETFYNRDCLFKGLKTSEALRDSADKMLVRTEYTWNRLEIATGDIVPDSMAHCFGPYYPAVSAEDRYFYEGQSTYQIHTRKEYVHGLHGNIRQYTNWGDVAVPDDSIVANITYYVDLSLNLRGLPDTIIVTDGSQELRRRYARYNPATGKPVWIQQINKSNSARIDLAYFANGNLSKLTLPHDYQNFRKELEYTYDSPTATYPETVTDNLGYNSSTSYDLRFGVPLQTIDVSGNEITFTYDKFGRVRTVQAPYEADQGIPWTIAFDFWDDKAIDLFDTLFVPYAITRHYDGMHQNNYITTSTFADGLGRALQTKKSSVVYENGQTAPTRVVSGKVYYDGLGRTVKAWQPITDTSAAGVFIRLTDPLPPTLMAYDAMDRQTTVYIPSGATSYVTNEYEYGFGADGFGHTRLKTTVTDANLISSDQYTDPRGLQTMVVAAGMATTQFVYNAMGELIESIDPEDNSTTYSYDMFGRVTQRNHPDAGTTIWRYDNAGNLRAVKTANLAGINDSITYNYDQGQLTHIHYPVNPEMDVYYEYGDYTSGNQAGRITRMQDASGVQQFSYGKLGEVIENIRTFVLPGGSETYTFADGL